MRRYGVAPFHMWTQSAIVDGSNPTPFDFAGDAIVDDADLDIWLALAGLENLPSHAVYLPRDANLDGKVDVTDLNIGRIL